MIDQIIKRLSSFSTPTHKDVMHECHDAELFRIYDIVMNLVNRYSSYNIYMFNDYTLHRLLAEKYHGDIKELIKFFFSIYKIDIEMDRLFTDTNNFVTYCIHDDNDNFRDWINYDASYFYIDDVEKHYDEVKQWLPQEYIELYEYVAAKLK